MPKFGGVLKDLRKTRGLSQAALAADLGWNQSKVSYLEALEEVPREEDLRVVCDFFGVTPSYFYEHRTDRRPSALSYLRSLATSPPEASPKAAIAFYSQLNRLSKDEQAHAVELAREQVRAKRGSRQRR